MREILFKGKRTDNGKWVEGYYFEFKERAYITNIPQTFMSAYYTEESIVDFNMRAFKIDAETVCQCTGLTDKNGRKIFEGDIVSAWSEGSHAVGRVKQRIDGLWLLYPACQNKIMWGLCPNNKGETTVEVIGNIFDNPELLESGVVE